MLTAQDGTIHVVTFKDGVLSRLGHDLRFRLERFEVEVDQRSVQGRFWPASLTVEGAVRDDEVRPSELSNRDRREIMDNLNKKVLQTNQYPEIRFAGELRELEAAEQLVGKLHMVGREASIEIDIQRQDGRVRGSVELQPSRWGIAPFKALLGALRIQDRVRVTFDLAERSG